MKFAYTAAVLLAIPVYLPRLLRSFWLDEAGTFWMAHEGFLAAIEKCSHWPGQSMLYGALASFFCLEDGQLREPLLRLPSLLAIGLMLYFTARMATRAMGPAAGLCAFILLLFHPLSFDIFLQARPYGIAAAAVAASYCLLYEWVETRQRRFVAGWAVASLLIFYLHYLYVVALLAQGLYLGWTFLIRRRTEAWKDLAAAVAGMGLLLLPLVQHMRLLVRESHTLSYVETPDFVDLVKALMPAPMMTGVIGAAVVLQVIVILRGERRKSWAMAAPGVALLTVGWWLIGTLTLFLISQSGTLEVFISRYLGSSAPAGVLLLAAIGAAVFEQRIAVAWAFVAVLATTGSPRTWRPAWAPSPVEARPMVEAIRSISPNHPPPVFFQSSLVESNFLDWRRGPAGSYAFNELAAYPIPNRVLPLPVRLESDTEYHVTGLLDGELKDAPEIVFVRGGEFSEWIIGQMVARGYQVERSRPNAYSIAIFRK